MIAALVDPLTGRIEAFTMPANESDLYEGQSQGALVVRWDTTNIFGDNPAFPYEHWYYNGTTFVERAEQPSNFHVYDWSAHTWSWNSEDFWDTVRQQRGSKISSCDWTQSTDSPLTDEKKAEWATYRTALRNVPASNSSVTDLDNITWPTIPS